MRPLAVEFAPRGAMARRLVWGAATAMWLMGGALAWKALVAHQALGLVEGEQTDLQAKMIALQASQAQAPMPRPEPPHLADAVQLARMAAFDLAGAMRALETVRVAGVRVAALELSALDASARVELEVVDPEALLRYVAELNSGEPRPRWTILRSQGAGSSGIATATILGNWGQ